MHVGVVGVLFLFPFPEFEDIAGNAFSFTCKILIILFPIVSFP